MKAEIVDIAGLKAGLGWTQLQIAEELDVERSTVSRWENGAPVKGLKLRRLRELEQQLAGRETPLGGVPASSRPAATDHDAPLARVPGSFPDEALAKEGTQQ